MPWIHLHTELEGKDYLSISYYDSTLDGGNHHFTSLTQILLPSSLPPHGNTGPSIPWWFPSTLRIEPNPSNGHTKTTVLRTLTPYSLSSLAAPVMSCGPLPVLARLCTLEAQSHLQVPGCTMLPTSACYSFCLGSGFGRAQIMSRASICWVLSSRHFIWVSAYKYFTCIIPFHPHNNLRRLVH